jgi:hypothetical protein
VTVRVLEVNLAKNQIALTMKSGKSGEADARPPQPPGRQRPEGRGSVRGPEPRAQASSGALKNDALRKLEQFKAALKGKT